MVMQFLEKNEPLTIEEMTTRFPYLESVLREHNDLDCEFEIVEDTIKLASPYSNSVCTNIEGELSYHKTFFYKNSIYKQPLAKALGIKKGEDKPKILDVTAGMLGDSLLIYSFGCEVEALERNPIAFILSKNAIANSDIDLNLSFGDAGKIEPTKRVVYFDPMYTQKNEKTLPKREMRIFREVIGADPDAKIVAVHLKSQSKRLVIKRAIKAMPLLCEPSFTVKGKSTAYDVYITT